MSNTPIVYSSADASAPQLTGQTGSLVALLDALLINGYGSGGTAKAACGWTAVSGNTSTAAAYRNSSVTGSGMHVQVNDNAAGTGGAKEAQLRGFETMSNSTTGTGQFPSGVQLSTGVVWAKSIAASSTTRLWWAVGCDRWLYLFIDTSGTGLDLATPYFIGDAVSYNPGDAAKFMVLGSEVSNMVNSSRRTGLASAVAGSTAPSSTNSAGWIARNYAQVPGGLRVSCTSNSFGDLVWGNGGVDSYPFVVNNGLVFERGFIHEGARRPRARMPGVYIALHPSGSFTDLQSLLSVPGMPTGTNFVVKLGRTDRYDTAGNTIALLFDVVNVD